MGFGTFAIAFASLYMVYSRQASEQRDLEQNLSVTRATLPKLISDRKDLESQLTHVFDSIVRKYFEGVLNRGEKCLKEQFKHVGITAKDY